MRCPRCQHNNPAKGRVCTDCGLKLRNYAGFGIRLVAWLIDTVVIITAVVLVGQAIPGTIEMNQFQAVVIVLLYYVILTGLTGQTLGKMLVGIKVVNDEGKVPGLGIGFAREVVGKIISGLVLSLGYLAITWDEKKRGWHDSMTGTYVVHTR